VETETINVLLIEDNPGDARLIAEILREARSPRFTLKHTGRLSAGLECLAQGEVDVVLLDLNLPDSVELEGLARAQAQAPQVPIVVLTGLADDALATEAMRAGAQDYLIKGQIDAELLARAIRYAIERKAAERELREAKEHLEKTFASQRDAIFILDAKIPPTILDCNPAAMEMFGYSREEMIGRTAEFLHVDEASLRHFQEQLYPAIAERGFLRLPEFQMKRRDGTVFPTEHSVTPLMDERGQRIGWVSVVRDITERKRMEETLRQQERLATVGQLAAGIAHDFNNILTSIIGFAEVLNQHEGMPDSARAYLKPIIEGGLRAAHLVRQILDFSRQSFAMMQPLDLATLLQESLIFLESLVPEGIHIHLEIGPEAYWVSADPGQIQQVLTNLAVNARDAMPEGGELRLRLSHLTLRPGDTPPSSGMEPGEWITLAVSDTGTGISPDVLPHIYEPFFTTKEVGQGTGLGLSQVYGIVKQHQGFIEVEAEVGKGTTFTIYLPGLAEQRERREEVSMEASPDLGKTILLAEDDEEVLGVGEAMLRHLGYEVLTASSGHEALEVYSRHREETALIVADIVMPEMGGVELFQELRSRDPEVKMVLITGYPLRDEGQGLQEQGIAAWIQKPLELAELARVIERVLRGEGERGPGRWQT